MDLHLKEIDYILAVADKGSISLAAQSLFISQPALSRYLIGLEERINASLFVRADKQRKLELTEVGRIYVRYAREIASQRDALSAELQQQLEQDEHPLQIGFMPYSGRALVSETIKVLETRHYGVDKINIIEKNRRLIEQDIFNNKLDIGFVGTPTLLKELSYKTIANEHALLVIHKDNPLSRQGVYLDNVPYPWIDVKLLNEAKFIATDDTTRTRQTLEELFVQENISPPISATTSSSYAALQFSEAGAGICLIFDHSHYHVIRNQENVRLFCVGNPVIKRDVGFAFRNWKLLPPVAREFIAIYQKLHTGFYSDLSLGRQLKAN